MARKKSSKTRIRQINPQIIPSQPPIEDLSNLTQVPITYQEVHDYHQKRKGGQPHPLRLETFRRIQQTTNRPLACYVTKTHNLAINIPGASGSPEIPAYIDHSDLTPFNDFAKSISGNDIDVFLVSNGGDPDATARIVQLLRDRFTSVRFIVPGNAFSAATLMCFSGNEIIMDSIGTLGPIDPQINGIPARAVIRGFEAAVQRLKDEGPTALSAYLPLISKYDLHTLEICKSAQDLSEELASRFLSQYMLECNEDDPKIQEITKYFSSYDIQKSHSRSISREKARQLGLNVIYTEEIEGLDSLVCSLFNQYEFFFGVTNFFKIFENACGISWGRQAQFTLQRVSSQQQPVPQTSPV